MGAVSFPVLAEQFGEDHVEPAAVPEVFLVEAANLAVARAVLRPTAGLVALDAARS